MPLKLIGAVSVKVRPDAEHFRDEAERDIKRQMKDRDGVPVQVAPEVDKKRLRQEYDKLRKKMVDDLNKNQKPLKFTTDIRFDQKAWDKARDHLAFTERSIRKELDETSAKLKELDTKRLGSMRLARELAQEHKKLYAQAMRGTASGNDVARIRKQYEIVRESLRATLRQIDQLKTKQVDLNKDMVTWAKNARDYEGNLQAAIRSHEDLIAKTAAAHRKYMAQVRKDSENLLGGLKYGIRKNIEDINEAFSTASRRLDGRKIFGFDFDLAEFRSRLQKVKSLFHRETEDMDDTEVDIKPQIDTSAYRIAWTRLKVLTRARIATIYVRVHGGSVAAAKQIMKGIYGLSGARKGLDVIEDFGKYIRDLDKHVPALGAIGSAAVLASSGITALVGSLSTLIVQLVQMSGAALALPGILGGFAVGIGAAIAVMRDFNKEVPQIGQDLRKLQDAMSDNFWKQAKIPLMDAWNAAFPHFSRGIKQTSTELGKWTASFSEAFATHFNMSSFDKMFTNLNASIRIASQGIGDIVKAMSILGETGSEYLPRFAQWGNDAAKGFANWLEEGQKTGKLNDIINTGIKRMKEFGKLTREAGEWVGLLGKAAMDAGFSGLKEMGDALERWNEGLKSPEGKKALDDIFEGAARVADGFKRAIGAITEFSRNSSEMLKEVAGIVGDMTGDTFEGFFEAFERPKFQNGMKDFFTGISDGMKSMTDAAPQISDLLGSVGSLAGTVASNLGKVVGEIAKAFGPEVADALDSIAPDLESAGDSLKVMVDALDDAGLDDFVADIVKLAGSGLSTIASDLESVALSIDAISRAARGMDLSNVKKQMKENLERTEDDDWTIFNWPKKLGNKMGKDLKDVKGRGWTEFWKDFADGAKEIGKGIGRAFELVGEVAATAMATAMTTIGEAWDKFTKWLSKLFSGNGDAKQKDNAGKLAESQGQTSLFDGLDDLGPGFGEKLSEVRETLQGYWGTFTAWLDALLDGGVEAAKQFVINIVINAIDNASMVIEHAKELALDFAAGVYRAALNALDRASAVISNVRQKAMDYAARVYQAALTARDKASMVVEHAREVAMDFAAKAYRATLTARDNATTVINRAISALRGFKSKAITLTTNVVKRVTSLFEKDGGVVSYYANGGLSENHVAQIAPAGAMRIWAEPETGGEAYIPMSLAKRSRSEQILATVADRFGMRLERYADGSQPSNVVSGGDSYSINIEAVPTNVVDETTESVMFSLKHLKRGGNPAFA